MTQEDFCPDDEFLQMFVEGTLSRPEFLVTNEHVKTCRRCRLQVAGYKQLMWDLTTTSADDEVPKVLEDMFHDLMSARNESVRLAAPGRSKGRSFIPAWAGYSTLWTRRLPGINGLGSLASRAGSRVFRNPLKHWLFPKRS